MRKSLFRAALCAMACLVALTLPVPALAAGQEDVRLPLSKDRGGALHSVLASLQRDGEPVYDELGDFECMVDDEARTVVITAYDGYAEDVAIPTTLGGYSVVGISEYFVDYNVKMKSVLIPAGVTSIGYGAFASCTVLNSIAVDPANPQYASDGGALYDKTLQKLLAWPSGITTANLPSTVTELADSCFSDRLSDVIISASVRVISPKAFEFCSSLQSIVVNEGNANYASWNGALFNKAMTTLMIWPNGIRGAAAVPPTVTTIGASAFAGGRLSSVALPADLVTIGEGAFAGCLQLASLTIPAKVTTIGKGCFAECEALKTIAIPASVVSIGAGSFAYCEALEAINVSASNSRYCSKGGVLFNKAVTTLLQYPVGKAPAGYTIPSGVKAIADEAFSGAPITSIGIPSTVAAIGEGCFSFCYNLKSVTLPGSVRTVGSSAFLGCFQLSKLTIPRGVTKIGSMAFVLCDSLASLTLPASLTELGAGAFLMCSNLKSAYFYGNLPAGTVLPELGPEVYRSWFEESSSSFKLYYHVSKSGSWKAYTEAAKQPFAQVTVYARNGGASRVVLAPISGGHISAPAKPSRTGFNFTSWYKDSSLKTRWDFKTVKITGDIKVYAGWKMTSASAKPLGIKAASADYNSVKVTWDRIEGVTKYQVFRATGKSGSYTKIKETTATSYTDTGRTTGKVYSYKIKAVTGSKVSKYSDAVSAEPVPGKPGGATAARVSNSSIKVSWKKVSGATKYQLYRSTKKDSGYSKVTETTSLSYTDKKRTDNKTYYYKVRVYRKVGSNKVYGAYSSTVSAKP